ncbi:membrane protein DedA with SNARE-associated domain [Saccharothrix ecbatanensis]|uniref:Membrane protein DedA with SNARE-associated domain n=1 Tax=Saccharothrix ecbatanensis TaxID=1105145 RepID=A0A7W9M4G1_9PSEU|nr:VTT domain-containing protein [Saccharothrix ecbatanensis]MBB5807070.1 membrane protein DedA with SNARE-associated domain [Saccharothrix ecbatanensis]
MTALAVLFLVAVVPLAPTEAVLIGCGVLAASGDLPLPAVILVATLGCALSDLVNFGVGRTAGMRALTRFGQRPGPRAVVQWTASRLATRGESILVAVRFVPGGGLVGAVLAGALRWPFRRFVPIALVGSGLWSAYTATLGFFGGRIFSDPLVATLVSVGVAMLISVPIGMAVKAAQRRVVDAAVPA